MSIALIAIACLFVGACLGACLAECRRQGDEDEGGAA